MQPNFFMICLSSFAAVLVVLIFLAVAMQIIMTVFPAKKTVAGPDDAALFAALTSTYARMYPGTRIQNIEEIKNVKP